METNRKLFDAHLHLNLKSDSPMKDLLDEMAATGVSKALLILNLPSEVDAVLLEQTMYQQNADKFELAVGVNIHEENPRELFDRVRKIKNVSVEMICLKVHPCLFNLIKQDTKEVLSVLSTFGNNSIIVDSLYYGSNIENHIGVELGLAIAKSYPQRKVIMAHSGSLDFLKCMMLTRYLPNVFYDYSFTQSFFKNTHLRMDLIDFLRRTPNRVMWGSDRPSFKESITLEDFISLAKEANLLEDQIQDVLYNNAENVYGKI